MAGELNALRFERFDQLVANLADQGVSQQEIARRTGLPPQYVSDVKRHRRTVSELFARRLAAQFDFDYEWLLGSGTSSASLGSCGVDETSGILSLPVVGDPIQGPPRSHRHWQGECIELAGIAAAKARSALDPYILRFRADDRDGLLQRNDLLLISQMVDETAELHVVAVSIKKLYLARGTYGAFQRVSKQARDPLPESTKAIGHCVGIVWRQL